MVTQYFISLDSEPSLKKHLFVTKSDYWNSSSPNHTSTVRAIRIPRIRKVRNNAHEQRGRANEIAQLYRRPPRHTHGRTQEEGLPLIVIIIFSLAARRSVACAARFPRVLDSRLHFTLGFVKRNKKPVQARPEEANGNELGEKRLLDRAELWVANYQVSKTEHRWLVLRTCSGANNGWNLKNQASEFRDCSALAWLMNVRCFEKSS